MLSCHCFNYSHSGIKSKYIYVVKCYIQDHYFRRLFYIHHTTEHTVYPKKYAHGFCFAVLCCGNTLTDLPISIRLTSLALWQSNDCPSASKATLMNMDKYFMWIHYERLHNHNKAKHNKTVCIFLGIYCIYILCRHSVYCRSYHIQCWHLLWTKTSNICITHENKYYILRPCWHHK